ncbi:repair protein Rad1/Rec1/Rad17 [Colletotrichum abscissum]|uniref:Repair protein Rad1/Rec1/Rad17 n=1 Tax=Colletotrichum abscissum TaxID=1671311 RepID=A0A9P9XCQ4_9PEZI|nr:repair protein Rad1/Rec1/Rad17 [Colletotrichum abscissum]KAI3547974.1 repair protein Rad1/Rec1/Rad17 [Colletotrichum abscissum]KAK1483778.1 repair protein Rad1/Rec1/Rad17 [Colletotrichum abscissum]
MDSSLLEVWQAAASTPFQPAVAKDSQFFIAFLLLLIGVGITGFFALNRSFINITALGVPASAAIASAAPVEVMSAALPQPSAVPQPLFRAVASSARPLYQLLRTISFSNKVHVQLQEDGIRMTDNRLGTAFLDKKLFTSYSLNLAEDEPLPNFQITLPALLETLQIFGAVDIATRTQKAEQDPYRSNLRNYRPDAFSNQTLGIGGTCSLVYTEEGGQFNIIIEESGVKTTASLTTYLPEIPEEIPFDRENLSFKIIMQARYLLDALAELAPTGPSRLTISASKNQPYLSLSGAGDLGSSSVDFAKGRELLETFSIQDRWTQTYKFDLIKSSSEAMRIASKISFRGDAQGVLSLQFMVEVEGGGVSFLDFRFVPFITHEDDEDEEGQDEDE